MAHHPVADHREAPMNHQERLRVLIVEDSEDDTLLLVRNLRHAGYDPDFQRVETEPEMRQALEAQEWDIIISDYKLPGFGGLAALEMYKTAGLDIPFIIVSGTIGEDVAVDAMVAGAHDYVMKNNPARLIPAITRELKEAQLRRVRRQAARELAYTESRQKALLKLYQMADASREEIVGFVVEECQKVNDSELAFVGLISDDQSVMHTHLWSNRAMEGCAIDGKPMVFDIKKAGLWGEAIRQKRVIVVNDYEAPNPQKKGYPAGHVPLARFMAVPLIHRDRVVLIAGLANKKDPYNESDITHTSLFLEGMWNYMERRKAEESVKASAQRLRRNLIGTIQVISMMLETRDPYTAGHQRRVSALARSMAQEMGLSKDVIDNIRMAGNIHDIGKMSVPAEVLVKPTRLSTIEMQLIRTHPRTGYDILKVADLPYPIAEAVLQHHERLDGSGYPQGLKGDEILIEACILSVADVVEAMAFDRPYRPALGIEVALEEIKRNRGIAYRPEAADACLRLFREKVFKFE